MKPRVSLLGKSCCLCRCQSTCPADEAITRASRARIRAKNKERQMGMCAASGDQYHSDVVYAKVAAFKFVNFNLICFVKSELFIG